MAPSISIVVPTHDRAAILARSLAALHDLSVPDGADVEALVVANACADATADVVERAARHLPFALRRIDEPRPGLNVARNRGLAEARGEIVAFLDDDAFLEPEWAQGLVEAFRDHPADLVAGKVVLWWEDVERPPWSSPAVETLLSCLDLGPEIRELASPGQLVGANFALRRSVAKALGGFLPGLDRTGSDLLSGGDTELAIRAQRAGYRLYYSPHMAVRHRVDPARIDRRYLDRVARGRGRTRVALEASLGDLRPWSLLRHGCAQLVRGRWRELQHRIRGEDSLSVAARLGRQRAAGVVGAALRHLIPAGSPHRPVRTEAP